MKGKHRKHKVRRHLKLKTQRRRQLFVLIAIILGVAVVGISLKGISVQVTMEP